MAKPLFALTAKQLEKALAAARRQYARSGSIASIKRLDAIEAEVTARIAA